MTSRQHGGGGGLVRLTTDTAVLAWAAAVRSSTAGLQAAAAGRGELCCSQPSCTLAPHPTLDTALTRYLNITHNILQIHTQLRLEVLVHTFFRDQNETGQKSIGFMYCSFGFSLILEVSERNHKSSLMSLFDYLFLLLHLCLYCIDIGNS